MPTRHRKSALLFPFLFFLLLSTSTRAADDDSLDHCATIEFGDACKPAGCTGGGTTAYVKNSRNDKLVRATVEITSRTTHEDPVTTRVVETIEAGDRAYLGCNSCSSPYTGSSKSAYKVVGCRAIK